MALESGVLFVAEAGLEAEDWAGAWLAAEFRKGSALLIELRPGISPVTALRPGSAVVIGVVLAGVLAGVLAFCAVPFDMLVGGAAFCGVLVFDPLQDWPVRPAIAEFTSPDSGLPAMSQTFAVSCDPVTAWVTPVSGELATVWASAGAATPAQTANVAEAMPPRKTCHLYTKRSRSRCGSEEEAAVGKTTRPGLAPAGRSTLRPAPPRW